MSVWDSIESVFEDPLGAIGLGDFEPPAPDDDPDDQGDGGGGIIGQATSALQSLEPSGTEVIIVLVLVVVGLGLIAYVTREAVG